MGDKSIIIQGSEKEEREEWKEGRAEHGRGLTILLIAPPGISD